MSIDQLIGYDLADAGLRLRCQETLEREGALCLDKFLEPATLTALIEEARQGEGKAFYAESTHSVHLSPPDPDLPADHAFNCQVVSTKVCICDDDIAADSPLRQIYNDPGFQDFLCFVLGEKALHPYADPLSSINIHYAPAGKELGWHFDNSEFAITLLLQKPESGGSFEYVKDLRDANAGEMNFGGVDQLLDGTLGYDSLAIEPGTLVLFRGRNSAHRVTPTVGNTTRYLVVLAYNGQPGISLSENARQTFYGRVE